jgi:ProP effector
LKPTLKATYATIELLAATWPHCFALKFENRKPLKIGIRVDAAAATKGAITPEELAAAFALYTRQAGYVRALKEGAVRVDLDGNPAGVVTAIEAAHAQRILERIRARESARTRARGLAIEAAAQKAKAAAQDAQRAAAEAKRAAEIAAGKRKPLLKLRRQAAAKAA